MPSVNRSSFVNDTQKQPSPSVKPDNQLLKCNSSIVDFVSSQHLGQGPKAEKCRRVGQGTSAPALIFRISRYGDCKSAVFPRYYTTNGNKSCHGGSTVMSRFTVACSRTRSGKLIDLQNAISFTRQGISLSLSSNFHYIAPPAQGRSSARGWTLSLI